MTPTDAARLLAHAAAFDNRQPSRAANSAWSAALHDVPLDDDALAAVARYYGTPPKTPGQRLWIQPHDIRTGRQAIRAERLETFVYEGDPDESAKQYLARRRSQLAAVASGQVAPPPDRPALDGPPHTQIKDLLEGIGQRIPDDDIQRVRRPGPLGIECPTCHVPVGRPCRTPGGKPRRAAHGQRSAAAQGRPLPDPAVEEREIARRRDVSRRYLGTASDMTGEAA
ncbi:hypothetical protein AB0H73_06010 [Streptomyces olivoreticuli]